MRGIRMHAGGGRISLRRGRREIVLGARDFFLVPFAVHLWDEHFETLVAKGRDGWAVLDFSEPGLHRYRRSGLEFHFPSFAEEDAMDAYTAAYSPRAGDVVWDAGANAGTTAYSLAKMVGVEGRVYAFEPDDTNYAFLLRNMEMHQIANVVPVKAALSGKTGTARFCMDGTICAGLTETVWFTAAKRNVEVETLSLEDACARFGSVPTYVKMDIEGAELDVIRAAQGFLRGHAIHFAIESNHIVAGEFTSGPLDAMLRRAGYRAWSSDEYGQRFTWATPLH
jgi:FkbM family methyltransferase